MNQSQHKNASGVASYSQREEQLNTLTHAFGAFLGALSILLFIINYFEHGDRLKLVTTTIYSISLTTLMLSSALYHGVKNVILKSKFKLFDHCAIYLLIAGTYTPLITHAVPSTMGFSVLALVWLCAFIGIAIKLKFGSQYKKFSVATYLIMGWLSLFIIYELIQVLPSLALVLLGGGGLIYSSGVYFYMNKKIPYNHAIWHLFVLFAALFHFLLIYFYI
jgi:hemolysin III